MLRIIRRETVATYRVPHIFRIEIYTARSATFREHVVDSVEHLLFSRVLYSFICCINTPTSAYNPFIYTYTQKVQQSYIYISHIYNNFIIRIFLQNLSEIKRLSINLAQSSLFDLCIKSYNS